MQEQEFYLELYKETAHAVNVYWDKYFTIRNRCTKEDIVQSLMLKALRPDRYGLSLYEKFREGKVTGGLKSLCMVNTARFLTDMVRTQKNVISVETELADGLTVLDTLSDNSQSYEIAIVNILERIPDSFTVEELVWNDGRPVHLKDIFYRAACGEKTTEICKDLSFRPKQRPVLSKLGEIIGYKNIPVPSKVSSTVVYNLIQGCRPLFDDILGEKEVTVKGRAA